MAAIHVLDKHTAELIAAGEVVERPASVVKELVENAIDAKATQITVAIEGGGIRLIEISDNGTGIAPEDIPTAFIRHATSKISCEDDLREIYTLGFRGEALASIASVARVELLTCTSDAEFASSYRIEGGEEIGLQPGARGVGTTIRVRDLFFNTPARMKFLKKDSSEGGFVADVVNHLALSHPEIAFRFVREGKLQYATPGDNDLKNTAYAVLGREFTRDLIPLDEIEHCYRTSGLITPPKACRASRSAQHFYINGRYVKNRTMMAALENAYKGTTMQGKFPGCVLMLDMPGELVDVNVHPAKTEVRFARENDVFDAVYHAVRLALTQPGSGERQFRFGEDIRRELAAKGKLEPDDAAQYHVPEPVPPAKPAGLSAVLPVQAAPGVLTEKKAAAEEPWGELDVPVKGRLVMRSPSFDAVEDESRLDVPVIAPAVHKPPMQVPDWYEKSRPKPPAAAAPVDEDEAHQEPEYDDEGLERDVRLWQQAEALAQKENIPVEEAEKRVHAEYVAANPEQTTFLPEPGVEPLRYVGEIFRTYIIAERTGEICLIDKHAAHERVIYEQLAAGYGHVDGQLLLAPVTVSLSAEEKQALLENEALLENVGLEIGDFGGGTVVVRAVPCDVAPDHIEDMVTEVAAKLAGGSRDALSEKTEWVLHSISCRAAMKAGDHTSAEQLIVLAEKILSGSVPPFCPHGRPCVLKLTRRELEKQFGRIE